jgi:hypothetical protein
LHYGLVDQAQRLVDQGIPADQACASLLRAAATRREADYIARGPIIISGGYDGADPALISERMLASLLHRCDPGRYPLPPEAREYRGLSLTGMRRELPGRRGRQRQGVVR